jgi:hypothetical protein
LDVAGRVRHERDAAVSKVLRMGVITGGVEGEIEAALDGAGRANLAREHDKAASRTADD